MLKTSLSEVFYSDQKLDFKDRKLDRFADQIK